MSSCSRIALIGKGRQGVFHCWTRCAQRACLLGPDPVTGKDRSYRRGWIIIREEQLAALFTIDIEFRAEMRNHLHVVLSTMPRVAKRLGREEVVRRWMTITKLAKCMSDDLPEINPKLVKKLAKDKKKVEQMRRRLSSISWFMGTLCENISRRSNAEAGTSGHFWESRFKCRECLDENAVLLCGIYVDLNPIKAGEAASPEKARYTSIYTRIQAQSQRKNARNRADGWLGELTLQPESKANEALADSSRSGRRASDMGILPISLADYLKLLKWTAKLLRSGERKTIPKDLGTILDYMEVNAEAWLDTVNDYENSFCHVVGTTESIAKVAERLDLRCMKGTTASRRIFG